MGGIGAARPVGPLDAALTWPVFGLVTAGVAVLLYALLTDDFSFRYVFSHSYRLQPTAFKIAALWSGQEGSLLFWLWLQAVMPRCWPGRARSGWAACWRRRWASCSPACAFFGGLTAFVASPFEQLAMRAARRPGLNPLLQSFWMISHPVMLYLGFVGLSVPFAVAMAARSSCGARAMTGFG